VAGDATAEGRRSSGAASRVEYRGATKRYPGQAEPAIRDLSLDVPAGEICVLVGPSGCGKTTALRLVNRMIELSAGDILIDGQSIRARPPAELRRGIGYVIQQIGLFPHLTVGDNIATVPKLLGWERRRITKRVNELLELTSLPAEMWERYPAQLSGGQRQRVGVARALAVDPPVMLMDEPFGAIDPINRERLQNQFLRLQSEIRKTILFVTHDIDEAIKMGDRVAVLERGGVLAQYATPPELLMSPANAFVEDFVGADRALKRLSLIRVREVNLWKAPLVRAGEPTDAARAALVGAEVPHPLVVDDEGRPLGWLSARDLAGEKVPATPGSGPDPVIELEDVLRDAMSHLLQSDALYGPVVDERGRVVGVLSVAIISDFLASDEATEAGTDPAERVTS
jgi:osmoprotectant transport system ATP-binding protein